MKRIKTLGLLALAVMALAAVFGTASASAAKFTSTGGVQKLTTSKNVQHVFTVTGSEVKCNKVTFTGETTGTEATSQRVTPKYEECTAFGLPATVTNLGCDILLTTATDANGHAEAHLVPQPGFVCEGFTILAKNIFGECHVEVTEQTVGGIHYTNVGTPPNESLIVDITASNLTDHVTKSTGVCPLSVGTHTNASYNGSENVAGASSGIQWDA